MAIGKKLALVLLTAVAAYIAGCATGGSTRQTTTAALDRILAGDHRSEANRARDVYRHPKETLLFFGIRPGMTVVEVWPGEGWYTEVIAPLTREKGRYYAATFAADPASEYLTNMMNAYRAKLAARPELYDQRADHDVVCGRWRHRPAWHGGHGGDLPQSAQLDEPGLGAAGVEHDV